MPPLYLSLSSLSEWEMLILKRWTFWTGMTSDFHPEDVTLREILYSSSLWGSLWVGRGRTLPQYRPFLPRKSWRKSRTSSYPTWNHATSNPNLRSKDSLPSHLWHHFLRPSIDWWTICDITSCVRALIYIKSVTSLPVSEHWLYQLSDITSCNLAMMYKPWPLALIFDFFQNCD